MKKEAQKKAEPEVILSQHDPFVCRCGVSDWLGIGWRSIEDVVMDCFFGVLAVVESEELSKYTIVPFQ